MVVLLVLYLAIVCLSLASAGVGNQYALHAAAGTFLMVGFVPLFLRARFSFGYLVGFSFYGMMAGFIWITYFSGLSYDHAQARISAIASLLTFLLPVLFITAPLQRRIAVSPQTMDRLTILMLAFAAVILVWNVRYGIALVGIGEAGTLRATFIRPALLNYVTGSVIGALLPFAFAYFALRRRYLLAAISIVLIVSFYPALLNKTVLLAAVWLPFLFLVFQIFEPRRAVVLALLLPSAFGLVLYHIAPNAGPVRFLAEHAFGLANVRMLAIPSLAMNYYSDFFAGNPSTYFCQINLVRSFVDCPYAGQLGPIFEARYHAGNLNASLFATEGIASVGPLWAPISTFLGGLILSVGNRVSARLPPPLIATSAGLVMQALLNVPLSVAVLSNGLLALLLLWYVTPEMSDQDA
ncbi:hypothetical protein CQ14_22595 [Bradyrhizobium lablabi]|uniref:Oligosaccharide repeat unit polymerase n=1 Tax=Bradyrhizobium lablabi TaxID=722472 RepID=A0A0R3N0T5_9BRAD|nr:hypothetical protein CQ14_22595 [Bradyrhizobium lablabi]